MSLKILTSIEITIFIKMIMYYLERSLSHSVNQQLIGGLQMHLKF